MPSLRDLTPVAMRRVALVAPAGRFRRAAVAVASRGTFEPDEATNPTDGPAGSLLADLDVEDAHPRLSVEAVDAEELAAVGAVDLLLGEATLESRTAATREIGRSRVLPGWMRADDLEPMREALDDIGAAIVDLPGRRGVQPPTALESGGRGESLRPLVTAYGVVPYRDVDPTLFAGVAYMVMFGMMFGDVAHGLAIVTLGALVRWGRWQRLARLTAAGPFLLGAGAAATVFGVLYGEAFGPTGLVPTLWLRPLDEPETLLVAGIALGAALLVVTAVIATVDRWREGGAAAALYAPSGVAGVLMLVGVVGAAGGWATSSDWATRAGGAAFAVGVVLLTIGLVATAGGRASGVVQAGVELFDTVLRLGSNLVSFARLAAFGLTHAVISEVVWSGTTSLWTGGSVPARISAVLLFVLGNVAAWGLGALVAAVQALRLEYYELFSRLFTSSGRPFDPWHVPMAPTKESTA